MHSTRARLRRVWGRALAACALYLVVALAVPRLIRGSGPTADTVRREEAPEYVLPSGERRRAVVFAPAAGRTRVDRRGERAILWWCGILAAVTLAGAVSQTIRIRAEAKRGTE